MTSDHRLARLITMLAYRRPAASDAEQLFIDRYITPLGASEDAHCNYHVIRPNADGTSSRVLWSCHTDTVHGKGGSQRVHYDGRWIRARKSDCLGADDTAGCFIMSEMARRNVPGHYVFHFGEERGCLGSSELAWEQPDWLEAMQFAIALDRHGYSDVITHQCARRTASDDFGEALAARLTACGLPYAPSSHGLYTDTEPYAGIIPECSNLSVGYFGEHSQAEAVDTVHVFALLDALCMIDVASLPVERDPSKVDYSWRRTPMGFRTADKPLTLRWRSILDAWDDDGDDEDPRTFLDSWQCSDCGGFNRLAAGHCRDCGLDFDLHLDHLAIYDRMKEDVS